MADPLVEVAVRVYADFTEHATLAEVLAVIGRCRTDLDTPSAAALSELIERLARQRLTDRIIRQLAPDARQDHPGYIGSAGLARGIRLREADQDLQDAMHRQSSSQAVRSQPRSTTQTTISALRQLGPMSTAMNPPKERSSLSRVRVRVSA